MPHSTLAPKPKNNNLLHSHSLVHLLGVDAVQILKCGICLEFFDVPIVLPCGHTFCLHCLTEMCRHACQNNINTSIQETRIGCPNCRVLIYASPVLERNVTCNFIIQSLIEVLRAREERKTQTTGVNTTEVRIGNKIRTPSDVQVTRVIQDMDHVSDALMRRSCLDNAFLEVEQIRREHLARCGKDDRNLISKMSCGATAKQLAISDASTMKQPLRLSKSNHPRGDMIDHVPFKTQTLTANLNVHHPQATSQLASSYTSAMSSNIRVNAPRTSTSTTSKCNPVHTVKNNINENPFCHQIFQQNMMSKSASASTPTPKPPPPLTTQHSRMNLLCNMQVRNPLNLPNTNANVLQCHPKWPNTQLDISVNNSNSPRGNIRDNNNNVFTKFSAPCKQETNVTSSNFKLGITKNTMNASANNVDSIATMTGLGIPTETLHKCPTIGNSSHGNIHFGDTTSNDMVTKKRPFSSLYSNACKMASNANASIGDTTKRGTHANLIIINANNGCLTDIQNNDERNAGLTNDVHTVPIDKDINIASFGSLFQQTSSTTSWPTSEQSCANAPDSCLLNGAFKMTKTSDLPAKTFPQKT